MLYFYFFVISFSIVGYGFLLTKSLNIHTRSFGFLGLFGISLLIFISYLSSLFLVHDFLFNSFILFIGLISFIFFFFKLGNFKKELILHISIFSILIIFILVGKNHDDFPYYHFPYSHFLTQYSHPLGFGQLNNGFRNPSSLFFLNSLFYLPKISFYLFHVAPAYFLGFSNLILIEIIFGKKIYNSHKFINFLSILSLIFINIFFYRLAEHGTDRSGQILVFILTIIILLITNNSKSVNKINNTFYIYFIPILLTLLISLKPFYLIYAPIVLILLVTPHLKFFIKKILFSKTFIYSALYIFFVFLYNFLNSGCIVYPALFSCFSNLPWSFEAEVIKDVNQWYELWSKAGARPDFVVENRAEYIANFNWLSGWVDNYFFNKVSDYLLGLTFLVFVFFLTFYRKSLKKNTNQIKINYKFVYIFICLCFIEWFLKHPALRYGGYQIIALLFFIPTSIFFNNFEINFKDFRKKSIILLSITLIVFFSRNINRLINENNQYKYNPINNTKFNFNDEKFYFRYNEHMNKYQGKYLKLEFLGKNFIIIKE